LRRFAALAAGSDLEGLKAWLVARYLTALAPYLPRAFADARFEFFGRVLTGQPLPFPRWQRGVSLVNGYLADAVGRRYVERHLPPQARSRAEALLARVLEAYREAVREADWMTAAARREALLKLARLRARVGQPDAWRDYGRLVVKADDLLGNVLRARELEAEYRTARVRQPDDHREWLIAAQAVNAYYAPATNEIVVTAAILQPPLFDPEADDASNLGAIGAVIGHELTHALDQDGRRFDARGAARDWWRPEDERAFLERARALAAQHAAQPLAEGLRIEGERTLRESVADLSGLSVAFRAYRRSLGGRPSPVRDGFTGEQRFFLSWARAFCGKIREEHVRQWLLTNPYPPPLARANVPAANLDAFQQAFGVESGDRLYVAPQKRVRFF
jgi:putative endopeptidase